MQAEQIITLENIQEIAQEIRNVLRPGIIVTISGPLGIGKTTLIKHILPEYDVASPSFLHALLYGENFAHIDAYTFKSHEAFLAMGIEEMIETRCVIIEWGELFDLETFDAEIVKIEMRYVDDARMLLYHKLR